MTASNPLVEKENDLNKKAESPPLKTLAVSVHCIATTFLEEVISAGLSRASSVYEIEDLDADEPGVIRQKGVDVVCSDGKKGASYVDCLTGADNVGKANYMLSWCWAYAIGDIIDTLQEYCRSRELDPKRTYVWICCLCINQHRAAEQKKKERSGMVDKSAAQVDFFEEFGQRVTGIGHMLAMMSPWQDSSYLQRIWCIFELYMAHTRGCKHTIVMPPREQQSLEKSLFEKYQGIENLYDALAKTNVRNAKASIQSDRSAILMRVEANPGIDVLNQHVNNLLRQWAKSEVDKLIKRKTSHYSEHRDHVGFADFLYKAGTIMWKNTEYEMALAMTRKAVATHQDNKTQRSQELASCHNNLGSILTEMGDCEKAAMEHQKALAIRKATLDKGHPDIALSYASLGALLSYKGDYECALRQYRNALVIQEATLGSDNVETAETYANIGMTFAEIDDTNGAIMFLNQACAVFQDKQPNHPNTAISYIGLANVLFQINQLERGLKLYSKAHAIQAAMLGEDHPISVRTCRKAESIWPLYVAQKERERRRMFFFVCKWLVSACLIGSYIVLGLLSILRP